MYVLNTELFHGHGWRSLLEGVLEGIEGIDCCLLGVFPSKFGQEDGDILVSKFDQACSYLDDIESLFIFFDFKFLIFCFCRDDLVDEFLTEHLLKLEECVVGFLFVSKEEDTFGTSDGIDSKVF